MGDSTIVFGAARPGEGRAVALQAGRTPALRIADAGSVLGLPVAQGSPMPPAAQLASVAESLAIYVDPWSRHGKLFLTRYFDFVAETVRRNAAAIGERLAPHGDVFAVDDVVFGALLPLPRPTLPGRPGAGFAFWTGEELLALHIAPAPHTAGARDWDVPIADFTLDRVALDGREGFAAALPGALGDFWRRPALPRGPLGTRLGSALLPSAAGG